MHACHILLQRVLDMFHLPPTPGKQITLANRFAVLAPGCIGTMNYSATSFSIERWGIGGNGWE